MAGKQSALKSNTRQRIANMTDAARLKELKKDAHRKKDREYKRRRYEEDPEFRKKCMRRSNEVYKEKSKDPDFKRKMGEKRKRDKDRKYLEDNKFQEKENAKSRAKYAADPKIREKSSEANKRYRDANSHTPEYKLKGKHSRNKWRYNNPANYIISSVKPRAKQKGWDFDLTVEFLEKLLAPMKCAQTGVDLVWTAGTASKDPRTASIDRIDSSKGYTQDNVQIVALMYNLAKCNWTHQDILDILVKPLRNQHE